MRYRHVTYRRRRNGSYDVLRSGPLAAGAWFFIGTIVIVAVCLQLAHWIDHHWWESILAVTGWGTLRFAAYKHQGHW